MQIFLNKNGNADIKLRVQFRGKQMETHQQYLQSADQPDLWIPTDMWYTSVKSQPAATHLGHYDLCLLFFVKGAGGSTWSFMYVVNFFKIYLFFFFFLYFFKLESFSSSVARWHFRVGGKEEVLCMAFPALTVLGIFHLNICSPFFLLLILIRKK